MGLFHSPRIVTSNLVGYWDPQNTKSWSGSGNLMDLSGNGYHATLTNAPTYSSGYFSYNGTSNYITVPASSEWGFPSSGTVCFWSNSTVAGLYTISLLKGSWTGYGLAPNSCIYSGTGASSNDCTLNLTVSTGTWYMTAFTVNRTSATYSMSNNAGTPTSSSITQAPITVSTPMFFGCRGSVPDSYLTGLIGPVAFYNRALSSAEIQQNFNALRGRFRI